MAEAVTKLPVKTEKTERPAPTTPAWQSLQSLRREIDQLFDAFDRDIWTMPPRRSLFSLEPLWRGEFKWSGAPAVDVTESDSGYEISAELPGLDEKNIEVKVSNSTLTIKGEKQEEKEEKKKDYYLRERHFGSFERRFQVPSGVATDKIAANFKNGVLKVTLPKTPEAQKAAKKIAVKAG